MTDRFYESSARPTAPLGTGGLAQPRPDHRGAERLASASRTGPRTRQRHRRACRSTSPELFRISTGSRAIPIPTRLRRSRHGSRRQARQPPATAGARCARSRLAGRLRPTRCCRSTWSTSARGKPRSACSTAPLACLAPGAPLILYGPWIEAGARNRAVQPRLRRHDLRARDPALGPARGRSLRRRSARPAASPSSSAARCPPTI